jgi:Predicted xylanase/chitin deacetylase
MPKVLDKRMRKEVEIVMWTWLSKDYDVTVSPEQIIQAAEQIRPGDILVFHDNLKATNNLKATLLPIIHLLKAKGYRFATL